MTLFKNLPLRASQIEKTPRQGGGRVSYQPLPKKIEIKTDGFDVFYSTSENHEKKSNISIFGDLPPRRGKSGTGGFIS